MSQDIEFHMTMNSRWKNLRDRWATFLSIALNPTVVLLGITTLFLIGFTIKLLPSSTAGPLGATAALVYAVLTVMIAVLSSVAGGHVAQRLDELTGKGILATRGKSAIRGLKLLLLNISALESRVRALSQREKTSPEQVIQAFEEIVQRCVALQEEALNAIEEWQDIVPEADLSTQIGVISTLKREQLQLLAQIQDLHNAVAQSRDQSSQEQEKLHAKLREKQEELQKLSRELRSKEARLAGSVGAVGSSLFAQDKLQSEIAKMYLGYDADEMRKQLGIERCRRCGAETLMMGGDLCFACQTGLK